ncbi:MAG TPA: hypothetical protein PLA50_15760 [Bacteroidia bacterium]|nr:hypothetical protein [Bacteroidia bacterium]
MKRGFFHTVVLSGAIFAAAALSARGEQATEGWSHEAGWKYEVRDSSEGEKDIWIVSEDGKSSKKLAETGGWGNLQVHISPDDRTIVVEDGGASLGIDLRVFRAGRSPLEFIEDESVLIGDKLEEWALRKLAAPADSLLGHRYVHAFGWSADGGKLLVSISGYEGELRVPGWFAIYDLGSGELSFDLGEINS